jgi:hypothetical protein
MWRKWIDEKGKDGFKWLESRSFCQNPPSHPIDVQLKSCQVFNAGFPGISAATGKNTLQISENFLQIATAQVDPAALDLSSGCDKETHCKFRARCFNWL